jgi:hypothetical protein
MPKQAGDRGATTAPSYSAPDPFAGVQSTPAAPTVPAPSNWYMPTDPFAPVASTYSGDNSADRRVGNVLPTATAQPHRSAPVAAPATNPVVKPVVNTASPAVKPAPVVAQPKAMPNSQNSVYDFVRTLFDGVGGNLGDVALSAIRDAHSPSEAVATIRKSDAYASRFPGNVALLKAGKAVMNEGEYLSQERTYRQVIKDAGLPNSFYDKPDDFGKWIAADVSPAEVASRAKTASNLVNSQDPATLAAFKSYYGIDKGHLAAYFLDPSKASPILDKQAAAASIGAEAIREGLGSSVGKGFSEGLVDKGITQVQARNAFLGTNIEKPTVALLSGIDHTSISTGDMINAQLGLDATAVKKVKSVADRETARFRGTSAGTSTLDNGKAMFGGDF